MTTKELILKAVKRELGNAQDNLYRARSAFNRLNEHQLDEQYGASGKTKREILSEYQEAESEWLKALAFASSL